MESKIINIKFFRKRIPVGLLLGIICFALLIMEGRKLGYAFGSLLLLVFPVILAIKIETEKKSLIVALNILWGLMLAFVTLLWSVMSIYLTHKALLGLSLLNLALNFAIFFVFVSVFLMIFAD